MQKTVGRLLAIGLTHAVAILPPMPAGLICC